jgi:hypothetical protein
MLPYRGAFDMRTMHGNPKRVPAPVNPAKTLAPQAPERRLHSL